MTRRSFAPVLQVQGVMPKVWTIFGVLAFSALILSPITWGLLTSFKTETSAVAYPPQIWPETFTWSNYARVVTNKTFSAEVFNSLLYSGGAVLLAIAVGAPAAYAASRFDFKGKNAAMTSILFFSMIPSVALLAPTFLLLDRIEMVNSPLAIIVISAARIAPQTVWFMKAFIDEVPFEIEEAAMMDGASRHQIVFKVVLPLIKPGVAATVALGMISVWNDYTTIATFAPDIARRTLQVALVNQVFDAIGMSWSYFMAYAVVASVPMIAVFLYVQKWFVSGLTAGSVKG